MKILLKLMMSIIMGFSLSSSITNQVKAMDTEKIAMVRMMDNTWMDEHNASPNAISTNINSNGKDPNCVGNSCIVAKDLAVNFEKNINPTGSVNPVVPVKPKGSKYTNEHLLDNLKGKQDRFTETRLLYR